MRDILLNSLTKDEIVELMKRLGDHLNKEYRISKDELSQILIASDFAVPVSIFTYEISPTEAIVKYLKENHELDFKKISQLLNRDDKAVWASYNRARNKIKSKITPRAKDIFIPIDSYKNNISILESTVIYLKDEKDLSGSKIAQLLNKKPSTIWTSYKRGKDKNA